MRKISFNKLQETAVCIVCGKNKVPKKHWNKPCDECKAKKKTNSTQGEIKIGTRLPAAVITDEDGTEHFIDKFGVEVKDHGYNLKDDPHGWKKTGAQPTKKTIIT